MEKINDALYALTFNPKLVRATTAIFVVGTVAIAGIVAHEVVAFKMWYAEPAHQEFVTRAIHSIFG